MPMEKYKPSNEEVAKAEEMMTDEQKGMSEQREKELLVIEEINDYENTEIRQMLEEAGAVKQGDKITDDDYETTRNRAKHLVQEARVPISVKTLILGAFADRMKNLGKITDVDLKKMPNDTVRAIVYARTGYNLSDEEIVMARNSPLALDEEYVEQRKSSKKGVADFNVAVNKTGSVVASGETPGEALRHAQDGQ